MRRPQASRKWTKSVHAGIPDVPGNRAGGRTCVGTTCCGTRRRVARATAKERRDRERNPDSWNGYAGTGGPDKHGDDLDNIVGRSKRERNFQTGWKVEIAPPDRQDIVLRGSLAFRLSGNHHMIRE